MAAFNMEKAFRAYQWGVENKSGIARDLGKLNTSRFTMDPRDAGIIAALVALCPGGHFEIGMLQGGSAILAAMAKQTFNQPGMIYGCDPFGWAPGQTQTGPEPSVETVLSNAEEFGVGDLIFPHRHAHPPLPEEIQGMTFDTTFIDGDHSYNAAMADWLAAKEYTNHFVLFHDIHFRDGAHGAIDVFQEACKDPDWKFYYKAAKTGVVRRVRT